MSDVERNTAMVRAFVDALNRQDWEALDRLVAPEFVRHSAAAGELGAGSRDDLKWFIRSEYSTFSDAHETLEDLVAEGDRVAARHRLTGTQTGPPAISRPPVWVSTRAKSPCTATWPCAVGSEARGCLFGGTECKSTC